MLIWIKVEQGHHLRYLHNRCCVHILLHVDKNTCAMMFDALFEHACVHSSVSVNGIAFKTLISQWD